MKKILLSLVSISAVALLGGCVSLDEYNRTAEQLTNEEEANMALAEENRRMEAELNKLRGEKDALEKSIKDMSAVNGGASQADLVKQFQDIWGDRMDGWEMVRSGNAVGVRIDDSGVLFASGSWTLTSNTKTTLGKLADIMKSKMSDPNVFCRVDGHTDIDPIKALKTKGIVDNVHLSAMRAMAVREFLASKGLPKERIFVAGFGEHWPVAAGKSSKEKQRNRRVEIYLGDPDALSIGALPKATLQK